jgi:AcrR family transcriptional regulator
LIRAAAELFMEKGLQPTLDDVAAHAGLGVATAYRHFSNKYDLADAVLSDSIEQMLSDLDAAADLDDAWEGLNAFMEAALRPQFEQRPLQKYLKEKFGSASPDEIHRRVEASIEKILDKGHRVGIIRPDVTSTDIGIACVLLSSLAEMYSDSSPDIWRRYVFVFIDAFRVGSRTALPSSALSRDEFVAGMLRRKQG